MSHRDFQQNHTDQNTCDGEVTGFNFTYFLLKLQALEPDPFQLTHIQAHCLPFVSIAHLASAQKCQTIGGCYRTEAATAIFVLVSIKMYVSGQIVVSSIMNFQFIPEGLFANTDEKVCQVKYNLYSPNELKYIIMTTISFMPNQHALVGSKVLPVLLSN